MSIVEPEPISTRTTHHQRLAKSSLEGRGSENVELVSAARAMAPRSRRVSLGRSTLGLDRFALLYAGIGLGIFFALTDPTRFATANNLRLVAASEAITGIIALGVVTALLAGMFDISVAANMSLAIILVAWLQSQLHVNPVLAVALTLMSGAVIGAFNALVITRFRVDPIIATLGSGSIITAVSFWIAQGDTIVSGISPRFDEFGSAKLLTVPVPVYYLAGIALLLWYLLEHNATGRFMYATGGNVNAARLAGLKVTRLQWIALILCGLLASLAGVVLTMQTGAASFGAGQSYLLPAFAIAFLGATQVRPGRFNVPGTLIALYALAVGVKGLELQYPSVPWIDDLFEGVALILAVGIGARARLRRIRQ